MFQSKVHPRGVPRALLPGCARAPAELPAQSRGDLQGMDRAQLSCAHQSSNWKEDDRQEPAGPETVLEREGVPAQGPALRLRCEGSTLPLAAQEDHPLGEVIEKSWPPGPPRCLISTPILGMWVWGGLGSQVPSARPGPVSCL